MFPNLMMEKEEVAKRSRSSALQLLSLRKRQQKSEDSNKYIIEDGSNHNHLVSSYISRQLLALPQFTSK